MTVSSTQARKTFAGDGVTTAFGTSPIVFFDSEDINVYVTVESTGVTTTLTEGTHYSVTGGDGDVGTLDLTGGSSPWGAVASGSTLIIDRDVSDTQETDLVNNDNSDAEVLEDALDRRAMVTQHMRDLIDRALRQPAGDSADIGALPTRVDRASKSLAFDSSGDPVAVDLETASGTTVTATGTTTARTLAERFSEIINVKDFGAVGDGVTDDSTAIQAAIDAAQGNEVTVYFPPGTYFLATGLSITGAVRFLGAGRYATALTWTSTSLNVITVTTPNQCAFEAMTFNGPASAVSGAVLTLTASGSAENAFSILRDLTFNQGWNHVVATKASSWTIDNVYFSGFLNFAVSVSNTNNVDSGDSTIVNSTFSNGGASSIAIRQASSGGLRVWNNKILGSQYAYRMVLASGAATGVLEILGNSMENQTVAAVSFATAGGGATFAGVLVCANHINNVPIGVDMGDSTAFLSRVVVEANHVCLSTSGTIGVLLTNVSDFYVGGGTITGTGATPTGVSVGTSSTKGLIGQIKFTALTTNLDLSDSGTTIQGPGATTLKMSGVDVSVSAVTTEEATDTITIPAGALGKSGAIRVRAMFTITNGADDKTIRFRFSTISGTAVFEQLFTTVGKVAIDFILQGVNATNAQKSHAMVLTDTPGVIAPTIVTSAIDTTANTTLVITGQKETAGNTITRNSLFVELIPSRT